MTRGRLDRSGPPSPRHGARASRRPASGGRRQRRSPGQSIFTLPERPGHVWTPALPGAVDKPLPRGARRQDRCSFSGDDGHERQVDMVARRRHLSGLPALLPGHERRRQRRSQGHHEAARSHIAIARRRRRLAVALLQVAHGRHGLRRVGLLRRRPAVRHDGGFRRVDRRGAPARPQDHHRSGAVALVRPASLVHREPVEPHEPEGRLVCLGRSEAGRHAAQQLALAASVARHGSGIRCASSSTCTISSPRSRTSISTIRRCRMRCSTTVRFWLDRGVDGFRLDTVNFYVHDKKLRDNPPRKLSRKARETETNPYEYQDHVYDKTRPENIAFLKRFRALLDSFDDRACVGEVGDSQRGLKTVAAYTSGADMLHMCYTFDLLGPKFSAAHVKKSIGDFEKAVLNGWICWAFSNHDVQRHVSRWTKPGGSTDDVARFSIATARLPARHDLHLRGRGTRAGRGGHCLRGSARSLWHPLLAGLQGPRRMPHADALAGGCSGRRLHHRQALASDPAEPPPTRGRSPDRPVRLGDGTLPAGPRLPPPAVAAPVRHDHLARRGRGRAGLPARSRQRDAALRLQLLR